MSSVDVMWSWPPATATMWYLQLCIFVAPPDIPPTCDSGWLKWSRQNSSAPPADGPTEDTPPPRRCKLIRDTVGFSRSHGERDSSRKGGRR